MNKQITMVGGIACVLVLAGGGCSLFKKAAVDTGVDAVQVDTQAEVLEESAAIAAGVYQVDTQASSVGWFGKRTVGNQHRGLVSLNYGQVTFAEDAALLNGSFVVDMGTIEDSEDNQMLERHLRGEDFFAVETYPEARFMLTSAEHVGGSMYNVTGELTIKATTQTVSFPATIVRESESSVRATATFMVDRAAFDVRYGSGSFFEDLGDSLIEDNMEFTLDLVATMVAVDNMEAEGTMMEGDASDSMEENIAPPMVEVDAAATVEVSL